MAQLSRKHFVGMAQVLREARPSLASGAGRLDVLRWVATVERVADLLAETNPRFDRALFLEATGANRQPTCETPRHFFPSGLRRCACGHFDRAETYNLRIRDTAEGSFVEELS